MKRIIGFLLCVILVIGAYAQSDSGEIVTLPAEKKYNLRPEFTARATAQFFHMDYTVSGGVNVNNKNTYGLMLGYKEMYDGAAPADMYAITSSLYYRHYFHLGKRQVCAFYIDANVGACWVYKTNYRPGDDCLVEAGDCGLILSVEPGFRVRLYKNLHIFLGPTASLGLGNFGLHFGIGF